MKLESGLLVRAALVGTVMSQFALAQVTEEELNSIKTPDKVETSLGTLEFFDGVPSSQTADLVYDHLDRMRGVDAFLKGMPGASMQALVKGPRSLGVVTSNQVTIFDGLLDSASLFLTGNTSTLYAFAVLDLEADGPTVVELPAGMLGVCNDMWFRYVGDLGPAGPDKGKGGSYLVLPPGYEGDVPEGYFVYRSRSYRMWVFMRSSIKDGVEAGADHIKGNLKIYPLAKKDSQPAMEFVSCTGKSFNTIHSNHYSFYEHLHELIDGESDQLLDSETRGLFAAIGIEKGKPFNPDARMKRLLTEAVAIGNATARAIVWYPRVEGARIYPDTNSAWVMAYAGKNVFFERNGALMSDARVMFHYPYTVVTPAMAVTVPGKGSDYGMAYLDARKQAFDGAKTYKLHLPPNVPVNNFWAVTIYDCQTRSQLQTSQRFPTVGSLTEGFQQNEDGSYDVYFGPKAPSGMENNWLETIPGKSWFVGLRMYGPLEPWIEKTWRPSEIELQE